MIIYINIDKNTDDVTVNNDSFPDSEILQFDPNTLKVTENNIKFEIAFNTTFFEEQIFLKWYPHNLLDMGDIDGNTN